MFLCLTSLRLGKKICNEAKHLPVHELLIALLRCKSDKNLNENPSFKRVLKRLVHWWCQAVERGLEKHLLTQCPDITVSARYHPWMRSSRAKGNRSLTLSLVGRFQSRSGGYINTKSDATLHSLGLVSKQSKIGGRTAIEYSVRLMGKSAEFVQRLCVEQGLRTINFCMDAAMVGEENVA